MQYFSTDEDILTPVLVEGALKKKNSNKKDFCFVKHYIFLSFYFYYIILFYIK